MTVTVFTSPLKGRKPEKTVLNSLELVSFLPPTIYHPFPLGTRRVSGQPPYGGQRSFRHIPAHSPEVAPGSGQLCPRRGGHGSGAAHLELVTLLLRLQSIQTKAAAELLVLPREVTRPFAQELVLPQQLLVLQRAVRQGGRSLAPPAPAPYLPQPLTSSSSSTTCCSSSVIRAFFLSRALWAATRFFSFLRGRAAVSGTSCTHHVQPQPRHRCPALTCAAPSLLGSDA